MEHFYQNLDGWFNYISIYNYVVSQGDDGDHFVEVGAWKGKSTAYLAVEIANSGKKIKLDVVDTWAGSLEHQNDEIIKKDQLYNLFLENMKPVEGIYNPRRMTSLDAAATYEDNSLDFVLLDASHEYEDVKADILAWLPKVKVGGILAGDDYHHTWPGVVKAVTELINNPQIVDNVTWAYKKE
jgi:predicted O-methyltransferase YrrM